MKRKPIHTISATDFKAQCLTLLDQVGPEGLVITKRGKAVARLFPASCEPSELIGMLREQLEIKGDILNTGMSWHAES